MRARQFLLQLDADDVVETLWDGLDSNHQLEVSRAYARTLVAAARAMLREQPREEDDDAE